ESGSESVPAPHARSGARCTRWTRSLALRLERRIPARPSYAGCSWPGLRVRRGRERQRIAFEYLSFLRGDYFSRASESVVLVSGTRSSCVEAKTCERIAFFAPNGSF